MKYRSRVLFAAIEAVEDTAETIVAADAILTTGITLTPYAGATVSRNLDKAHLGADSQVNVNPHLGLVFGVELAGGGAADTPPAFDPLLQICGLDPTVNAGTDVTYNLLTDSIKTATVNFLRKTQLHEGTGVRGNLAIQLAKGQIPKVMCDKVLGTYYTPSAITEIVGDFSAFTDPIAVTKDNTPTVTVDGFAATMQSFSMNLNNQVIRNDMPGARYTRIGDRAVSGQIVIVAPDLGTKNFFSSLESHSGITTVPIVVEHGAVAGEIVKVTLATAQLSSIAETDIDGDLGYQMSFLAVPTSAGNDEVVLLTK